MEKTRKRRILILTVLTIIAIIVGICARSFAVHAATLSSGSIVLNKDGERVINIASEDLRYLDRELDSLYEELNDRYDEMALVR